MSDIMGKYDVSVIISIYNKENFLKRTIGSVINQTLGFENIELILVDNKSTDSSRDIMNEYDKLYDNVKCIYLKENSGTPCTPRNTGIENASGEYLMFLDADDTYDTHMCEKLYSKIKESGKNIVGCQYNEVKFGQSLPKEQLFEESEIEINPLNNNVLLEKGMRWWMCWDKIYNREFIMKHNIRFPPDLMAEDVFFVIQSFLLDENMILLNDYTGYNWYIYDDSDYSSLSHTFKETHLLNFIKGYDSIFNLVNGRDDVLESLFRQFIHPLFGIFCYLDDCDYSRKKELLGEIYNFVAYWNLDIKFNSKYVFVFNKLLLNKNFNTLIVLSIIVKFWNKWVL